MVAFTKIAGIKVRVRESDFFAVKLKPETGRAIMNRRPLPISRDESSPASPRIIRPADIASLGEVEKDAKLLAQIARQRQAKKAGAQETSLGEVLASTGITSPRSIGWPRLLKVFRLLDFNERLDLFLKLSAQSRQTLFGRLEFEECLPLVWRLGPLPRREFQQTLDAAGQVHLARAAAETDPDFYRAVIKPFLTA